MIPTWSGHREDLNALHAAALSAADPAAAVDRALRLEGDAIRVGERMLDLAPDSRIWLIAFGKASPGMARAALAALGNRIAGGVIAHPHSVSRDAGLPPSIQTFAAGHPLPDEGSLAAGEAALALLEGVRPADLVLVLVSGGGSALFEALRPGIGLADLRALTADLQHAGADIVELNTVRRALSRIKGGGLSRSVGGARLAALLLSDVIGDRIEAIASGPTVDSPTTPADALAVLARRGLTATHAAAVATLEEATRDPGAAAPAGERIVHLVGTNRLAADALCAAARERWFATLLLTDRLAGEAREVGVVVGHVARGLSTSGLPLSPPACVVWGGETTVTVRGKGKGGRNLELALGAAAPLAGAPHTVLLSFATDGVDGSGGAAGALVTGETLTRAAALGLSADAAVAGSDTAPFFAALGDLWTPGPSGTNVNDLVVILAYPG
jgi:hydroxypyruvate reductase